MRSAKFRLWEALAKIISSINILKGENEKNGEQYQKTHEIYQSVVIYSYILDLFQQIHYEKNFEK